jgi:hypothetical protein
VNQLLIAQFALSLIAWDFSLRRILNRYFVDARRQWSPSARSQHHAANETWNC